MVAVHPPLPQCGVGWGNPRTQGGLTHTSDALAEVTGRLGVTWASLSLFCLSSSRAFPASSVGRLLYIVAIFQRVDIEVVRIDPVLDTQHNLVEHCEFQMSVVDW